MFFSPRMDGYLKPVNVPVYAGGILIKVEAGFAILSHDQNRDRRFLYDRFRNTPKPQSLESSAAMASHNDKVRARVLRDIE